MTEVETASYHPRLMLALDQCGWIVHVAQPGNCLDGGCWIQYDYWGVPDTGVPMVRLSQPGPTSQVSDTGRAVPWNPR
jgi:hypothetical protein